jgi:hypothetical protein
MTVGALLGGTIAGVAGIVLWELFRSVRRRWRNRRLIGLYEITRKQTDQPLDERASIKASGSVLTVEHIGLEEDGRSVVGRIAIDERLPQRAEGYYSDTSPTRQLWGFWKLQVKDVDTLLVHTSYANPKTHELVTSGFVWSRIQPH